MLPYLTAAILFYEKKQKVKIKRKIIKLIKNNGN